MNYIELSTILYYADFLSMKEIGLPITDNCKYYFIYNTPINSAYIVDLEPIYDTNNKYFVLAYNEYILLRDKFGEDGVLSFINNIANLSACGVVDGRRMLNYIHQFSTKIERKYAIGLYNKWKNNLTYTHLIKDENGNPQEQQCTKYFKHAEIASTKRAIHESAQ